ncbi:hypothetical protein VTI74DRAFT_7838 [Chaetomium olivicolor]
MPLNGSLLVRAGAMQLCRGRLRKSIRFSGREAALLRDGVDCCGDGRSENTGRRTWLGIRSELRNIKLNAPSQPSWGTGRSSSHLAAGTQDGAPHFGGTESDPHYHPHDKIGWRPRHFPLQEPSPASLRNDIETRNQPRVGALGWDGNVEQSCLRNWRPDLRSETQSSHFLGFWRFNSVS